MKTATFQNQGGAMAALLALGLATVAPELSAVQVDSEVVILVDVSSSVNNAEFANVMEGIASSFESAGVVDSIVNGSVGSIAASLVFWSNRNRQQVGVSWLELSDASSAASFAAAVRGAARPFNGRSAIGSAIAYGTTLFGSETGGAGNGFESDRQIISLFGDGRDNNTPGSGSRTLRLREARDAAIAAGVDEVSAVLLNSTNANLLSYYESNILGGDGSGNPQVTAVDINNVDLQSVGGSLANSISEGAVVPEPSPVFLTGFVTLLSVFRRNRLSAH